MGIGTIILEIVAPLMESMAPLMPGDIFPKFFTLEMFQRSMLAAVMVAIVAGFLGTFLLIRNLALIGDGLAHVSFGGVAIGIVIGASSPLWYALVASVLSSICIYELQSREILTGDASIAIFLTGMLALGLVILRYSGVGITVEVESYLWGSLLLTSSQDLDLIASICVISFLVLIIIHPSLLATTVDPLAARVQGIPVRAIGLMFSIITAAVVVSMVQVVGTLLVTALLVTPAATAQQVGNSFRSCLVWTQIFGISSVFLGLYFSAELDTGSGAMIALVAAVIFSFVTILQTILKMADNKTNKQLDIN
jgi:zinc transport system permease protein